MSTAIKSPPSAVRVSLLAGLHGGLLGAVMSALVNYTLVGMPHGPTVNAAHHAMSGLASGFFAGFFGLLSYRRRTAFAGPPTVRDGDPRAGDRHAGA
ncbi:hypothetical protein Asp14428_17900 [Actinoplanes sp. NBRC 14428]|uniref:Uncharacterized protein n=1 Tax=Pseudosporangium ferrugineum TaxID=439699 RepID=A0A2T0SBK5_9ACTN|nr:hypothetical protein [Pseudosporangium ferrugineum]PRY30761.1 hypothetical protein CLV70_104313 [Pseudosporangium ferrugineum]BCJ50315.1 hypothetical protein Asp14428_17900 [Actinoplanes sp. NBRC 14428]